MKIIDNMADFKITSKYKPLGDQPKAIKSLVHGLNNNKRPGASRLVDQTAILRSSCSDHACIGEAASYIAGPGSCAFTRDLAPSSCRYWRNCSSRMASVVGFQLDLTNSLTLSYSY